jgi:transcriptional regulator with XRE-family HTH domain
MIHKQDIQCNKMASLLYCGETTIGGAMDEGTLGERIRRLRDERYLSQAELATKAGISRAVLSRLENDLAVPIQRTVRKLAEALGVSPHALANPGDLRTRRGEGAAA